MGEGRPHEATWVRGRGRVRVRVRVRGRGRGWGVGVGVGVGVRHHLARHRDGTRQRGGEAGGHDERALVRG